MLSCVLDITLIVSLYLMTNVLSTNKDCIFSFKDVPNTLPLLLKTNYKRLQYLNAFIVPDNNSLIHVKYNSKISLHCPGSQLQLLEGATNFSSAIATCFGNKTFTIGDVHLPISNISCTRYPQHLVRDTGKKCLRKYKQLDLGIELADGKFLKHIEICYDDMVQTPLYSAFRLTRAIGGAQHGLPRPSFRSLLGVDRELQLNDMYKRENQRESVNRLLCLERNSTRYINETGPYYLARGHLTARADFIYSAQQRVTFYYVNTAPQWQTFNGGSWNRLEQLVRRYAAAAAGADLHVYTGTYGVVTLPSCCAGKVGELMELYMYRDANNNRAIPVPELFWKVVHNPRDKAGVAFLGVNNPFKNTFKPICNDICDEMPWLKWNRKDAFNGYGYCCAVDDFRRTVQTIPNFQVDKLLK